jgi:hypothetical protein
MSTALPAPGIVLADQGSVGGEDVGAATHVYYPAISVDSDGNMALGFSASGASTHVGAYYATRKSADAPGTIDESTALAAGLDGYERRFGGARNRWGNFSGIALDPDDDATFYVYNAYAGERGTIIPEFPDDDGRWRTKLGWFRVKPSVAVAISHFDAVARIGAVAIAGEFSSNLEVEDVVLWRATRDGVSRPIATVFGSRSRFDYLDDDVQPGQTYRYQLVIRDRDGAFASPIVTATVPTTIARLEQNAPNPFNPTTTIRFVLATRAHATLAIYDAAGRLVRVLIDGVVPAGAGVAAWDGRAHDGSHVVSGVYFCRLETDGFTDTRKMVLLK